jgi:hypothetical protein
MLKRQIAIVEKQAKAEQRERRKVFMKEIAAYKKEKGRRNYKWVVLKGLDPSKLQSILNGERIQTKGTIENQADFVPFDSDNSIEVSEDDISIIVDHNPNCADPQDPQDSADLYYAHDQPSELAFGDTVSDSDECIMSELSGS